MGKRSDYRLDATPIGRGGQATVFRALHKSTGRQVAFKRLDLTLNTHDVGRFKREIEVLQKLVHPNIMPILDLAEDRTWYTMPLAEGDLTALRQNLDDEGLADALIDVARGLNAMHGNGLSHRDVTPGNAMLLDDAEGRRWVISDLGLVRRPHGETTVHRTMTGMFIGTPGFAPPEADDDAHEMDERSDVYSLGRIAAWAVTGKRLKPNIPEVPIGPWRDFILTATQLDRDKRLPNMDACIESLLKLKGQLQRARTNPDDLFELVKGGSVSAAREFFPVAVTLEGSADLFMQGIAVQTPDDVLLDLVTNSPEILVAAARKMAEHLHDNNYWYARDFDGLNPPLIWLRRAARAAAQQGRLDILQDLASILFSEAASMQRFAERKGTQKWLETLRGEPARVVAAALVGNADAIKWYTEEGWVPYGAAREIVAALRLPPSVTSDSKD